MSAITIDENPPTTEPDGATLAPVALGRAEAEALGGQIVAAASRVASVTAAWVGMVGEFDAREGWVHSHLESTAHWLQWACSMSRGTAREQVRVARGLRVMPVVSAAFARGDLSYSKVRECTRIAGLINEDTLLACARDFTAAQLERAVRGYKAGRTARLVAEQRRLVTHRELGDGSVQITAVLPPEEAAIVLAALDVATTRHKTEVTRNCNEKEATLDYPLTEMSEDVYTSTEDAADAVVGVPAGTPPAGTDSDDDVPSYTRADALIDVARGFIDAGPADLSGEDRDLVVVHVTAADLAAAMTTPAAAGNPNAADADVAADAGVTSRQGVPAGTPTASGDLRAPGSAWIEHVGSVHASAAARIACTGLIQAIVTDTDGEVLTLGRQRRLASKAQKRALKARDRHCQFPGCIRTVRLHAHHLTAWSTGGLTDVDAMILLCQHHHVIVHAASITITKARPGFTFTRVDGTVITAQRPDEYSRPSATGDWRPPADERLLDTLTADALVLDAAEHRPTGDQPDMPDMPSAVPAGLLAADDPRLQPDPWQLPEMFRDLADVTEVYDPRATHFPRWAGERLTEGSYYDLMEYRAATERTNPDARY